MGYGPNDHAIDCMTFQKSTRPMTLGKVRVPRTASIVIHWRTRWHATAIADENTGIERTTVKMPIRVLAQTHGMFRASLGTGEDGMTQMVR